jgi:hypothetical protein
MRPWQALPRSRRLLSPLAAVCAAACVCLVVVVQQQGKNTSLLLQEASGDSLTALERQKARLQSFISQEDGGRRGPSPTSTDLSGQVDQPDAGGVAAKQAADKHCGKLCQTRKMILKARGRIDTQAHVELQQLAVSFAPSLFSAV